ncbi:MAG: CDP-glycerol glycerophosphotransferase family protein [Oscillospiraceae bacterium]|jgi:hypothetical protein|nr:CDP-glycerol glycerophosphotransferase family protein [Oscillospiraceae bacterium]
MRKNQQKQILELLQTLEQAQASGLYAECQDGALSIGEFIESIKGEGTKTVTLLEEYCELIFKASNGEASEKQLKRHLIKVENSVKSELKPDRIEMVFLSYKASMSDSLESIYLTAKEDPNCDAYWIPIPYYEKNPDGSLGKMHYEGADYYGKNIECTNWQQYDIEVQRPDAIFTFAPYDNGNYVTSIHPDFYCERLRRLTDLLVYIPYFVVVETVGEIYITVAGCMYAHKVIVQSEEVRSSYIKTFKETFGNQYGKPEDKFVALGSPKFDEVINSKCEDYELPEEWQELISNKKVILYNTTVHTFINTDADKYYKKMKSVFDTFRKRDDVVLWWRPHPHLESGIMSLFPHKLSEYKQIIEDYIKEGFGIYDDTADLHRAVTWSDAYYGDWSSVILLYQTIKKPVIIQDFNTPYAFTDLYNPRPLMMPIYNEKLYYTLPSRNAIFEIDINSELLKPKYYSRIPDEPTYLDRNDFRLCFVIENEMWFLPYFENEIKIYNFESNSYSSLVLELKDEYKTRNLVNFRTFLVHDNTLFLFPLGYRAIVSYDLTTYKTTHCLYISEIFPEIQNEKESISNSVFLGYEYLNSSRILLPTAFSNKILEFSLSDNSYVLHKIGDNDVNYGRIFKYKEEFWIYSKNRAIIYRWNYYENKVSKYTDFPKGFKVNNTKKGIFFNYCAIKHENYLYLFPAFANMVCRVNMDDGKIEEVTVFDKYIQRDEKQINVQYFATVSIDNSIIYLYKKNDSILRYCIETQEVDECNAYEHVTDDDYHKLSKDFYDSFLAGNEECKNNSYLLTCNLGTAGKKIYDYIKN